MNLQNIDICQCKDFTMLGWLVSRYFFSSLSATKGGILGCHIGADIFWKHIDADSFERSLLKQFEYLDYPHWQFPSLRNLVHTPVVEISFLEKGSLETTSLPSWDRDKVCVDCILYLLHTPLVRFHGYLLLLLLLYFLFFFFLFLILWHQELLRNYVGVANML